MFSKTFIESKRAAYWKTIPHLGANRHQSVLAEMRDLIAIDPDFALRRFDKPRDAARQRRFSRTGEVPSRTISRRARSRA